MTSAFFQWTLTGAPVPLPRQKIVFDKTRISDVTAAQADSSVSHSFGSQFLLLPGFVNAHTHLEFSDLNGERLGTFDSFAEWVRHVLKVRQDPQRPPRDTTIRQGLAESHVAGTALIGEIATSPWPVEAYDSSPVAVIPFLEQLGFRNDQAMDRLAAVTNRATELSERMIEFGISPHAPYSTGRELFAGMLELAGQQGLPIAMHLAESADEMALIQNAQGPFRELLEELGLFGPTSRCLSIDDCLSGLAQCVSGGESVSRHELVPESETFGELQDSLSWEIGPTLRHGLVIHGNYLTDSQIDFVSRHPQLTVVYCPRTHQRFGHPTYPLCSLLERQVPVALGTDSRASNPDLNVLSELRTAGQIFPDVPRSELFKMATHNGAAALGLGDTFGKIESGFSSHAVLLEFESAIDDPWEALFEWKVKRLLWLDELT